MKDAVIVGAGAALGASTRWLLTSWVGMDMPATLVINIISCFAMGFFRPGQFWGMGVLGGFSTMSAFALLTASMKLIDALLYTFLTVLGCLTAVLVGRRLS